MGGKKGWFSTERFLFYFDRKLKKGGQKVKKGPLRFLKDFFQIFCKFQPAKTSESRLLASSGFPAPPHPPPFSHPPPLCFQGLPERLSFLAWNGIVTLWTSTSEKAECADQPCIFSWPMMISNSVNEFFVAV